MSVSNEVDSSESSFDVPFERRPKHVAIIMDGNGRWAEKQGLPRIEGHRLGVESIRRVVEEATNLKIEQITLYCLSTENWNRPESEVEFLLKLLGTTLINESSTLLKHNVKLRIIGRRSDLPEPIQAEMARIEDLTANNSGVCLCLAINYGARAEIVDAIRTIATQASNGELQPADIDETLVADSLYTRGMRDPDLLIRTAGEMRVSNYLLWQISYSEFWVTDRYWPEFDASDLHAAIRAYASRRRRFGGLDQDTDEASGVA